MSDNLHILELATYEAPVITESSRENWVEFGEDNDYFNWLIGRYTHSTTNNAVINNMSRLIYGRGIGALDASRRPMDFAQLKTLFRPNDLRKVSKELKMLGNAAFQVVFNKKHTKVVAVHHIPVNNIRAEKCNEEGEITGYYYSDHWEDTRKYAPKRIPAFGSSKEEIEILYIQPFSVGMKYYSAVDYQGCLPYCVLEEEVSEYLINEVQNGFSGTKVINFNNGVPTEEQQRLISKKVKGKLTGSNGDKVIIAFNDNAESTTTVDDIPLNDAPEHYAYLSTEASGKILVGHNVVSPMLVGVTTDNQGFSSNADEIEVASRYFYNIAVKPFQDLLIDAIDSILAFNNVSLDLYFKPLNLLEDVEAKQQEKQAASNFHSHLETLLDEYGEDESEDWELIDSREVDYDLEEDFDKQLEEAKAEILKDIEPSLLSKIVNFATGIASPNKASNQDKEIDGFFFKVRYKYVGNPTPERGFCKQMMSAAKIYRKEDIIRMGESGINREQAHENELMDIWRFKGGVACKHKWERRTYVSASKKASIGSHKTNQVSTGKARKFGYRVRNEKEVSMKPNDMPYDGHHPEWVAKHIK